MGMVGPTYATYPGVGMEAVLLLPILVWKWYALLLLPILVWEW